MYFFQLWRFMVNTVTTVLIILIMNVMAQQAGALNFFFSFIVPQNTKFGFNSWINFLAVLYTSEREWIENKDTCIVWSVFLENANFVFFSRLNIFLNIFFYGETKAILSTYSDSHAFCGNISYRDYRCVPSLISRIFHTVF